ncbi:post-exponential-phase responses transcriptional regulator [Bacillus freudenreichii]|nr:post-exponential-phase responses transcriptional regulator [Bacillus freudenreichii]
MIGEKISELRKEKGLSLTELAHRAQVSKSYLSNIERNLNQNPSINIVMKIADVLGVDFQHLIDLNISYEEPDEDWLTFVRELKESGIQKEEIKDYKPLIEFIKWKNRSDCKSENK